MRKTRNPPFPGTNTAALSPSGREFAAVAAQYNDHPLYQFVYFVRGFRELELVLERP